jgi:hypothetical protein
MLKDLFHWVDVCDELNKTPLWGTKLTCIVVIDEKDIGKMKIMEIHDASIPTIAHSHPIKSMGRKEANWVMKVRKCVVII